MKIGKSQEEKRNEEGEGRKKRMSQRGIIFSLLPYPVFPL
jgi:hypothetical protein